MEGENEMKNMNKAEKKARKALAKLGLKPVTGVVRCSEALARARARERTKSKALTNVAAAAAAPERTMRSRE